jgi:hypothetical protein
VEAGAHLHPQALVDHVVHELVPEPPLPDDVALLALQLLETDVSKDDRAPAGPDILAGVSEARPASHPAT